MSCRLALMQTPHDCVLSSRTLRGEHRALDSMRGHRDASANAAAGPSQPMGAASQLRVTGKLTTNCRCDSVTLRCSRDGAAIAASQHRASPGSLINDEVEVAAVVGDAVMLANHRRGSTRPAGPTASRMTEPISQRVGMLGHGPRDHQRGHGSLARPFRHSGLA